MKRKNFIKTLVLFPLLTVATKAFGRIKLFVSERCKTQSDIEGPFYKAQAPSRSIVETDGTPLLIEGKILKSTDCETPIVNAVVDVWHCDNDGDYDMEGYKCRAQIKTDSNGKYSFTTIFPPAYGGRPRHIHFKVRANGYPELTTQLYFKGDPKIKNDFARNAQQERVIELAPQDKGKKGKFNIYL